MPGVDCIGKSNRCHETAQVVCSLQNNVGGEDVHCRSLEQGFT
jgi:hypothetical protein